MDLPVCILAHGRQERLLDLPFPKHFLQVAGEPIVVRTLRLLEECGSPPPLLVAPDRPEWASLSTCRGLRREGLPADHPGIAWSVGELLRKLEGGALFILGDVAFSRDAIRAILANRLPIAFFGRPGPNPWTGKPYDETYALRCDPGGREAVLTAVTNPRSLPWWKLRDLRIFIGLPHVGIGDWTDDVDTDSDLMHVLPVLDRMARSEAALDDPSVRRV